MLRKVAIAACAILSFTSLAFGQVDTQEDPEYDAIDRYISCKAEIAKKSFIDMAACGRLTYDDVYFECANLAQAVNLEDWEVSLSKIWEYCISQEPYSDKPSERFASAVVEWLLNPQCLPACDEAGELEKLFTN